MIMYFHPSVFRCVLLRWVRLLGFAIMYGTVILKLYRYRGLEVTPVTYEISCVLYWFLSVCAESCEVKTEAGPSSPLFLLSEPPPPLFSHLISRVISFWKHACADRPFYNDAFLSLCVVCFRTQPRNPHLFYFYFILPALTFVKHLILLYVLNGYLLSSYWW